MSGFRLRLKAAHGVKNVHNASNGTLAVPSNIGCVGRMLAATKRSIVFQDGPQALATVPSSATQSTFSSSSSPSSSLLAGL